MTIYISHWGFTKHLRRYTLISGSWSSLSWFLTGSDKNRLYCLLFDLIHKNFNIQCCCDFFNHVAKLMSAGPPLSKDYIQPRLNLTYYHIGFHLYTCFLDLIMLFNHKQLIIQFRAISFLIDLSYLLSLLMTSFVTLASPPT